jgi:hypothetical protein
MWTRADLRHAAALLRQGRNPASVVNESLEPDFFLALDDDWLNLGLWGDGSDPPRRRSRSVCSSTSYRPGV